MRNRIDRTVRISFDYLSVSTWGELAARMGVGLAGEGVASDCRGSDGSDSGNPSDMLEQLAHRLGCREWGSPLRGIGSPQHLQIRTFIRFYFSPGLSLLQVGVR